MRFLSLTVGAYRQIQSFGCSRGRCRCPENSENLSIDDVSRHRSEENRPENREERLGRLRATQAHGASPDEARRANVAKLADAVLSTSVKYAKERPASRFLVVTETFRQGLQVEGGQPVRSPVPCLLRFNICLLQQ